MIAKALPFPATTLALYGDTSKGKSTCLAKLAEYIFEASGGKLVDGKAVGGLRTLVRLFDDGSIDPYQILFDTEIATLVDHRNVPFPDLAIEHLGRGEVPTLKSTHVEVQQGNQKVKVLDGGWAAQDYTSIGLDIYDSGSAIATDLFQHQEDLTGDGIGTGKGSTSYKTGGAGWGTTNVGLANVDNYTTVQSQMERMIGLLGGLSGQKQVIIAMTFAVDRGKQESNQKQIVGPMLKGGAKTAVAPGWFGLCFHVDTEPVAGFANPMPVLYTSSHTVNGAEWLANRRIPIPDPSDKQAMAEYEKIPYRFAPADLVAALKVLQAERAKAKAKLVAKLSVVKAVA